MFGGDANMMEAWDWTVVRKVKISLNNIYSDRHGLILKKNRNENAAHILPLPREEKIKRKERERRK